MESRVRIARLFSSYGKSASFGKKRFQGTIALRDVIDEAEVGKIAEVLKIVANPTGASYTKSDVSSFGNNLTRVR